MRLAVIDLGTNSTRLLIGDFGDADVRELERISTVTRLGEGLERAGSLASVATERTLTVVDRYAARIARWAPDRSVAVATSAVREAANGEGFTSQVEDHLGIPVYVISGEREAELTFAGALFGRRGDRDFAVVDIGGGSTEIVVGRAGAIHFRTSMPLGAVRQTERHLHADPPDADELAALREDAAATLSTAIPPEVAHMRAPMIAVAGTPTSLASIDQSLDPYDSSAVEGHILPLARVEEMLAALASRTLDQRRSVVGLHPDRAYTIVAGAAILAEAMGRFRSDRVEVSERDLLYGAAQELLTGSAG